MKRGPRLLIQAAPHFKTGITTPRVMWDVTYGLIPIILAALWFFGLSALLVLLATLAGVVLTEWLFSPSSKHDSLVALRRRGESLADGSAVLTALLLGLTLPPSIPLWMAFLGGVVAIGLGKLVWGGLGNNLFNPALVGRAFLQAAFPSAMTTWTPQGGSLLTVQTSSLALPFMQMNADGVTAATPLGLMKFQQQFTPYQQLIVGDIAGSLGETSGLLIILAGIYLVLRRTIDWRIPVAILASTVLFAGTLSLLDETLFPDPLFMVFSGGLLFGAVYMATDPATSPLTPKGAWLFGSGIGTLVVLIRVFGGLPEGVMYAILLMNAATPLIARYTQPRAYGHKTTP